LAKLNKKYKKSKKDKDIDEELLNSDLEKEIHWYPGHINKAIKEIKERIKMVNIILEIRDARSPLVTCGLSNALKLKGKSCLTLINKTDLADPKIVNLWKNWFKEQNKPFIFINCIDKNSLKKIVSTAKKIVHQKQLESNPGFVQKKKFRMMVIGLPNTGKSTLINKLATRNATKVANKPGQTRHQLWVNVDKELEILDTPGVMPPVIEKEEHGLWLSALHAIPDKVIGPEDTACYIVTHLLKIKSQLFIDRYKLNSENLDLIKSLEQIATTRGCLLKKNQYDFDRVYKIILSDFRSGKLGKISFGLPPKVRGS
jgi:ribosome biogenesis GTPase A